MRATEVSSIRSTLGSAALVLGSMQLESCCAPGDGFDLGFARAQEVLTVVMSQQEAWNRGDLVAFMEIGYWKSPDLTFYSGGKVSRGYDEMLAHYRASYEGPGKELGKLAFTQTAVELLDEDAATVRGRWDLDYAEKKDVGGLFTLVFRRIDEQWRIVHDHTSVDG
jgi:uncharacterized protein (TIGR02246 family)